MQVFLFNSYTGEEIPSPINFGSFQDIISKFREMTINCQKEDASDSFFGVVDNQDRTLQFAWMTDDNCWLVDIPDMANNGSYSTKANYEQCVEYISKFHTEGLLPIADCQFNSF